MIPAVEQPDPLQLLAQLRNCWWQWRREVAPGQLLTEIAMLVLLLRGIRPPTVPRWDGWLDAIDAAISWPDTLASARLDAVGQLLYIDDAGAAEAARGDR